MLGLVNEQFLGGEALKFQQGKYVSIYITPDRLILVGFFWMCEEFAIVNFFVGRVGKLEERVEQKG
jgi:hypothetical protein